ncbi:iron-containing alcohol dehydrogenase [Reyranella sp. CPCC 100927]|uniref:iron-containing alcohol dehydrogenase n=1 Tax=Reyranella sp. CPCC 100927 TaxID=2599616 RepID=UPI0011B53FE0|nr:iron-containing alcohol dehydrogenase [Reyranella sp. CPCC 100927]TWT06119.1 iron-containing alcohol dehydrogenase [Reyranella sp. CPCC 100927]
MQSGTMAFTAMNRVIFGKPAAEQIVAEADRLRAGRVFVLTGRTLNTQTEEIAKIRQALGARFAGVHDDMPAHTPREAVVACANAAREAGTDLLVNFGGGSVIDGGKAVAICLEHGISTVDGLEPLRSVVENGQRRVPDFRPPVVRQIAVPTTLSAGEHNARAGVTDTRVKLKQSFINRGIVPETVILDPAVTVHTPAWLWLSSGVRALDHAVETYLSLDANDYTDGTALQALRTLGVGLPAVKADAGDLDARLRCMMGAWLSMVGIVAGMRMGASHAIGHILGGSAGVAHGHTSCVMMPYVLDYNVPVNRDRQRDVSAALGRPAAVPAAEVLDAFVRGLGMPRSLREVGIAAADLPGLAENCMLDDWTYSNPRPITRADEVLGILKAAY